MDYSERFKKAKTAVFWDVDGCEIPDDRKAIDVSQKIRLVLEKEGYRGSEATIYAYGDTKQMMDRLESSATFEPLEKSGDRTDMVTDYHGTGHIFADKSHESPAIVFNHTPAGYNIILVQPKNAPPRQLLDTVVTKLLWESLLVGQIDIIRKEPSQGFDELIDVMEEEPSQGFDDTSVGSRKWKSTVGVGVVGVLTVLARFCQRSR